MQEEKKEFFEHGDIKTMQKDIKRTREEEAEKERERISALKPVRDYKSSEKTQGEQISNGPKTEQEAKNARQRQEEARPTPSLSPSVPRPLPPAPLSSEKRAFSPPIRPTESNKILIRIGIMLIIVLIFANIFLFWYWYLRGEKIPAGPIQEQPEETAPPEEEPTPEQPETATSPEEKPEPTIPLPLIPIEMRVFLETTSTENIMAVLSQTLKTELIQGYSRILIQNTEQNKILGLKEFFEAVGVAAPAGFYDKLDDNFTLFIFSQKQGSRLGFVAKITKKEGLSELLKSWEATMENDFANLFLLLGKVDPALVSYFKAVPYKEATLRYQTFSRQDLGICYAMVEEYFVWTSSWESLLKTIDKLTE